MMRSLSIVVPCFNEEPVVEETYRRLCQVFMSTCYPVELIFIDDGSTDDTLKILKGLAAHDERVRVLAFSRNFGHQAAVSAGLHYCTGTEAAIMDADLQDPPEVIPKMMEHLDQSGCNVVYGKRVERRGESFLKNISAKVFYRVLNSISDVRFPADVGDFRVVDRKVIDVFNSLPERNKYIRGLFGWIGFKQTAYEYVREGRFAGKTKYTPSKMMQLAADGLFSFSRKPLRAAVRLGLLSVVVALLLAVWVIVTRLSEPNTAVPGWASTIVIIVFLGGVQLLSVGVLGEYIGSIFDETKGRPEYVVADSVNLPRRAAGPEEPAGVWRRSAGE